MEYGQKLVERLSREIETLQNSINNRYDRIDAGWTDMDDCFVSQRCESRGIDLNRREIDLINDGGCAWFEELATLDNQLVSSRWIDSQYGYTRRVEMPDGKVVFTSANTAKGLAKKGLKKVSCKRPAWFKFHTTCKGMLGAYTGEYIIFPSDVNYATGEDATDDPVEVKWDI